MNFNLSQTISASATQSFMVKVYGWMSSALAISGLTAFYIANYQIGLIYYLMENPLLFYGTFIAQIGLVIFLSARIAKINTQTAILLFYLYALSVGFTFSIFFLVYTAASLATTFFITAGTFGAMCLYGYTTKTDLTSIGNILFMMLIGLIIASIVNIFLASSGLYWITTFGGVLIFVGLTAYDTQKIKNMAGNFLTSSNETIEKAAIMGALSLYLDFINLFIYLLRLFGQRSSN